MKRERIVGDWIHIAEIEFQHTLAWPRRLGVNLFNVAAACWSYEAGMDRGFDSSQGARHFWKPGCGHPAPVAKHPGCGKAWEGR